MSSIEKQCMNRLSRFEIVSEADSSSMFSDCDCACTSIPSSPLPANGAPELLLQRHPHQQQQAITDTYNVVFVPSVSQVAVVNHATLELLDQFSAPTALHNLDRDAYVAAGQLYQLGLLQVPGSSPAPPPRSDILVAWLHVTNACNLRCTYCYIDTTSAAMSAETGFAAVDALLRTARLHAYRDVVLKYAGGEASLNLALVEQLQRYASIQASTLGIGLRGVVLSNGFGLTRPRLQCIQRLGLRLMISLDGTAETHDRQRPRRNGQGSFQAVIASITRAQELGLTLTVSITMTSASAAGVPAIVVWLLERGIHFTLNLYRACDSGAAVPDFAFDEPALLAGLRATYQEIEQRLPKYSLLGCLLDRVNLGHVHHHTCAVGTHYLVIDQAGNVAKCHMHIQHPVTTIFDLHPLETIRLDREGVQNMSVDEKEGCRECRWKYWCAGGCPVATQRATGRYDMRSPNCSLYQTLYPEVLRLEGLRLLHWKNRTAVS